LDYFKLFLKTNIKPKKPKAQSQFGDFRVKLGYFGFLGLQPPDFTLETTQGKEIPSEPSTDSTLWTKKNYLLLALGTLVKFGDGEEIYLPGVITQKVSCELGLSPVEEGFLAVIIYVFLAVSVLTAVPLFLVRFNI
jgi:hypothetical protein